MIAACLGLGLGYLVFTPETSEADVSGVSTEEADRVVALLNAYEAAWNANDPDAVLELFTDDYVYADGYKAGTSKAELARKAAGYAREGKQLEHVGDPVVVGRDGTNDVSVLWVGSSETTEHTGFGITVYRVVDEDGVLKIRRSSPDENWFLY